MLVSRFLVLGTFSEIHNNNFGYSYMGELVQRKEFEEFDKMTAMGSITEEDAMDEEPPEPLVDEDGFESVRRKGKGKGKKK